MKAVYVVIALCFITASAHAQLKINLVYHGTESPEFHKGIEEALLGLRGINFTAEEVALKLSIMHNLSDQASAVEISVMNPYAVRKVESELEKKEYPAEMEPIMFSEELKKMVDSKEMLDAVFLVNEIFSSPDAASTATKVSEFLENEFVSELKTNCEKTETVSHGRLKCELDLSVL